MWGYVPLVVIAAVSFVYWYITRTFNYWKNKNVPGPEPEPLFGNIKEPALRRNFIGRTIREIYEQFPNEKVVGIYRMTTPCLLIRDLEVIKHIMIKDFDLFVDRGVEFSKEGLGANLFHADGDTWRVLRTKFSPLFTSGKLKNMFHLIVERGDRFIEHLEELIQKQQEQDVLNISKMFTMSTISACAFGLDIEYNDPKIKVLKRLDELTLNARITQEINVMFPGLFKKLNLSIFPKEVKSFFYDIVKTVVAQRNGKFTDRKDFMDLMLELNQQGVIYSNKNIDRSQLSLKLNDDLMAANAFIFYVAGFETSSTTVTFLLYELSQNPDIQDKVIAEIDEVVRTCDGKITYDALMDMPYLAKVFDETLRKYPIIDPLKRKAQTDYKIPGTDVTVPKGMTVLFSVSGIHHDPKNYPNPEVFDPERFTPENAGKIHPCAYLPFGLGPRNCIGMRFAKVQSRMFLVKLFSNYRVEPSKYTHKMMEYSPGRLVLAPNGGLPLNIVPRHK